ncbi:MAG: hypothetical protein HY961_21700 [Ignavibacteriae bacterium]|nr:hypothetical protein [Ignavibacteriota bacterium]
MTQEEVLQDFLSRLERFDIRYMVAGSYAANQYAIPRATYDADIVIEADEHTLRTLIRSLDVEFYADEIGAIDALRHSSISSIVHKESGFKIDLVFLKDRRYSDYEFKRRSLRSFHGTQRWIASAEDTILTKLEWSKMGNSERQFNDALNVAKVQADALDVNYLKTWAEDLGVTDLLERILAHLAAS